ncbi:hypothetical protein [Streptomyces chrestomyceticus]|uniref:hypothetical protein n=1 Tax=Streptomyces chrestomyceticus TaxID=68185 RepID=UPI0037963982
MGRATAELLHTRGYRVAVTGQIPESLARAQSGLPGDVLVVRSDGRALSDTDVLVSAVSAVSTVSARSGSRSNWASAGFASTR